MKPRTLSFLLAVLMSMVASVASAEDFSVDGIYYSITSSTAPYTVAVTYRGNNFDSYSNEYTGSVIIPESVSYNGNTYSVTSIGNYTFSKCSGLTFVTIPESVIHIGNYSFGACSGLTTITIPNSVTSIGYRAFTNCSGLTTISIPNSVTYIGEKTFYKCSGLTTITIPNSVTYIGEDAFRGCSGLTSVTIPKSVTNIGTGAFYQCSSLTKAEFACIESLCGIQFGTNANPLVCAHHLYIGGTEVTDLVIPNSVTSVGDNAFDGCSGLSSVTIGNSVTSIGGMAFYNCSGLSSVTIGNSVTSIGDYAFCYCSGLASVTIPNSVTSIGTGAFYGTAWSTNQTNGLVYAGKVAYGYKGTMPEGTEIVLEDGTLGVAEFAFYGSKGLTSITIPNSVTSIGGSAFSGCTSLSSVTIGNSVTNIGYQAFYETAWYTNQSDGLVYAGKVAYDYKGAMPEGTEMVLEDGTLGVADLAFYDRKGLTSVTIPNSLTSIGGSAFSGCTSLTSVTIPKSVTNIVGGAFSSSSGLTSIVVESGNPLYDSRDNCNAIIRTSTNTLISGCKNTTIPNSVTSIGSSAFFGCSGLTSVIIPNNVTTVEEYAFKGCTGLTSITIPNSVKSIGNYAFDGCNGLTSVIVEWDTPINLNNTYIFRNASNITLYVPKGTKAKYEVADYWQDFKEIVEYETEETGIEDEHEYVDLGLPSGTLWATCNVGANSPEEYGDYFAWGETTGYKSGKTSFSWSAYKYSNGSETDLTKYCSMSDYGYNGFTDTLTELLPEDDAATVNWGMGWCIPTIDQIDELFNNSYTTTTWTTQNGVKGRRVTSKSNGNSIFLPAAGWRDNTSLLVEGSFGIFWSRTLNADDPWHARYVNFNSSYIRTYENGGRRYYGFTIRPVREKNNGNDSEDENEPVNPEKEDFGEIADAVDLGLSVKWASWNLGASSIYEYGGLYGGGDPTGTATYFGTSSLYHWVSGECISGTEYDLATIKWGSEWRIPTLNELEELRDKCTWEFSLTIEGIKGVRATGPNGNSIFIPCPGTRHGNTNVDLGYIASIWSGETCKNGYNPGYADLDIRYNGSFSINGNYYYCGQTIRPVTSSSTGIKNLNNNDSHNYTKGVYDLSGRRINVNDNDNVNNSKLKKGIYIVNGKKVVK